MGEEKNLQTTVATLLLITSAVVLACVVVDYAVGIVVEVLHTENIPQLSRIRDIENGILNQTDNLFNQTQPELPNQPPP